MTDDNTKPNAGIALSDRLLSLADGYAAARLRTAALKRGRDALGEAMDLLAGKYTAPVEKVRMNVISNLDKVYAAANTPRLDDDAKRLLLQAAQVLEYELHRLGLQGVDHLPEGDPWQPPTGHHYDRTTHPRHVGDVIALGAAPIASMVAITLDEGGQGAISSAGWVVQGRAGDNILVSKPGGSMSSRWLHHGTQVKLEKLVWDSRP